MKFPAPKLACDPSQSDPDRRGSQAYKVGDTSGRSPRTEHTLGPMLEEELRDLVVYQPDRH